MGIGYTRNDTSNNIADGNIINAADLDGEFDAIESAFGTSGHTHDGTSAEGGPITVLGPVQDFVASATEIKPKTTNTLDIGTTALQFKDFYLDGKAYIDGLGESILVDTNSKIQFRDTALFINSSADGQLDIEADTTIELTAPTVSLTDNLKLKSDAAVLSFGADDEITVTHVHNTGLDLKNATGFDLNLQTSDTTVESGNLLGKITFNAPDEASGTDAIVVGAAIEALAEATFDSATNSTALVFKTNTTGAATERMRIKSDGNISLTGATTISNTSGDLTFDVVGDIILDADGADFKFRDGGAGFFTITNSSLDAVLKVEQSNEDFIIKGNDGGSEITALTLDMSDAGTAIFNHDITLPDNGKAIFGAGSDLQIYHDGSASYIQDTGTGALYLQGDGGVNIRNAAGTENKAVFASDGAVTLYHDNAAKFATTSTGIDVTGTVTADGLTVDSGSTNTVATFQSTDAGAGINFTDNTGSSNIQTNGAELRIGVDEDAAVASSTIKFRVDGSTKATIDSSGNVGIDFTPKTMTANVTSSLNVGSGTVFQRTKDTYLGSNMYYNASDVGKSISTGYGLAYYQDVTNGAHKWFTSAVSAGSADATHSFNTLMILDSSGSLIQYGAATFNEGGADADFRVESDSNSNMLVVDASFGSGAGAVGIGVAPAYIFQAEGSRSGDWVAHIKNTHSSNGYGLKVQAGDDANVQPFRVANLANDDLFHIRGNGKIQVNTAQNTNADFQILGSSMTNLFYADASANLIGINTNAPDSLLHVNGQARFNTARVLDNNSSSPLFAIKSDDAGPWSLQIQNDTYNTSETYGFRGYVDNNNNAVFQTNSNASYQMIELQQRNNTTTRSLLKLGSSGNTIFNDSGADIDFRVESDSSAYALYVSGSDDGGIGSVAIGGNTLSKVGISGNGALLHLHGDDSQLRQANGCLHFDNSGNTTYHWRNHYGATSNDAECRVETGFFRVFTGTSFTERMRVTASGDLNTTGAGTFSRANAGFTARNGDSVSITRSGGTPLEINRTTNDGPLINFFQAGVVEGQVSVSGSTVSYNGGHLARWSQLTDGSKDTSIVKGTVMTNLDQMCVWRQEAVDAVLYEEYDLLPEGVSVGDIKHPATDAYDEDNEQLNCMAVSSTEGDANVAGVFVNWDDDNDMNIAMTGDMVIRIAQGTTVSRGDLLMSAGDGTAKPQGDDIVRSKTIAKVTSTNVSHTYNDGSYLVPCVLMAC